MERDMRRGLLLIILFVGLLLGPVAARYLFYYRLGPSDRAAAPRFEPLKASALITKPDSNDFVDEPEVGRGLILLDQAHMNDFDLSELRYLDGRLAARGFQLVPYTGGNLASMLRAVAAFVVVAPLEPFRPAEVQAVTDFVQRGGRLLLLGDPTSFAVRFEETEFTFNVFVDSDDIPLNSLANEFDLNFNGDYVFNVERNESNFRNIILEGGDLGGTPLTESLDRLVLYGSHSLTASGGARPVLVANDDTFSSATDRPEALILAAMSRDGRVLAVGDTDFLMPPYFTTFDNRAFIARIADFLTGDARVGRSFVLADFPFFLDERVDLVFTGDPDLGPDAFDEIIALQEALESVDVMINLADEPQRNRDVLWLGLYNQADDVVELLASAGISLTIDPPILPPTETETATDPEGGGPEETPTAEEMLTRLIQSDFGKVQMSGTALIVLDQSAARRQLVVLAASLDGLEKTVERLLGLIDFTGGDGLDDCLLTDALALCPTGIDGEVVEAILQSGGLPEAGVETDGEAGEAPGEPPGAGEFNSAINATIIGAVSLGETVSGELGTEEAHGYTFSQGPVTVDIVLTISDEMDGVLEVYDPEDTLLREADRGFTGEEERLIGLEIADDGTYTIVVRDFFEAGGTYELTVTEALGERGGIFIFGDDDGVALAGGETGAEAMADILAAAGYEVTVWLASIDGALSSDVLEQSGLVIWATGDYRDEEGFDNPDAEVILTYLNEGRALFLSGATPLLYEPADLATLVDLEFTDQDETLARGFSAGEIISLDQPYEAVVIDTEFLTEEDIEYVRRGPDSAESGAPAGLAFVNEFNDARIVVLLAPFAALPADSGATLLLNILAWFGLQPG